jgi:hypothetical protein
VKLIKTLPNELEEEGLQPVGRSCFDPHQNTRLTFRLASSLLAAGSVVNENKAGHAQKTLVRQGVRQSGGAMCREFWHSVRASAKGSEWFR